MAAKVFQDVSEIINDYTGLSRKVLDYNIVTKEMNAKCKLPSFQDEMWDEHFAQFFDKPNFLRVGHLKEEFDYPSYLEFQTKWAPNSDWECSFKRIAEVDNVVYLELEERATFNGMTNIVNTLSVYEFNDTGKVYRLDLYLQQTPLSKDEIPDAYK